MIYFISAPEKNAMTDPKETLSARLSLCFSSIGHTCSHLFGPIFYVVALALEKDLNLPHGKVIMLIVAGNVLLGVAAPVAGWLGDRWSATGMMSVFFIGAGGAMILTGMASTPLTIGLWLAATGLFASIYHPVGISWLVRHALNRGMALGINGIFGGIGPAVAALSAGFLVDLWGWRAAFLVPGAVLVATGLIFSGLCMRGVIIETKTDRRPEAPASSGDRTRAFLVLAFTMLSTGIIYQATQAGLPKVFSERVSDFAGGGVLGVSALVAMVYFFAGIMQLIGGWLADRFPLKTVYIISYSLQIPFLFFAASLSGTALVVVAMIMVATNVGSLPAENSLVARYAPSRWRGLVFGFKFIVAFGIGALGVVMEGMLYDLTGGFYWLFTVLAVLALLATLVGVLLPNERPASPASQASRAAE